MSRAGNRNPKYRPGYGRFASTRRAWLRTNTTQQLILHAVTDEDRLKEEEANEDIIRASSNESGTSYILTVPVPGRIKGLQWDLSGMTHEELVAFKNFMDLAISLADPVVRERDKAAHEAQQSGDDTFIRLYRDDPVFVDRERAFRKDGEGVHDRPQDASEGNEAH